MADEIIVTKICSKCKKDKELNQFPSDRGSKGGFRPACKECDRDRRQRYYAKNQGKRQLSNNKWRAKNIEKARLYRRRSLQKARATPKGAIDANMRLKLNRALNFNKINNQLEIAAEYSVYQLSDHIEKQFSPEMTWENYGTYWQLDHKIPISTFSYTNITDGEFKKCWSLENLQPLEAAANNKKGANLFIPKTLATKPQP